MLCSQIQLRRQETDFQYVKLLPCRSWGCDHCNPRRQAQLKAMAASGRPRSCLTLTVNTATGSSPVERYRLLHAAWKNLIKRILRQFRKPPEERWLLKTEEEYPYQEIRSHTITRIIKAKRIKKIHYMAFAEETELGEPHLHILLRTHFIPQRWVSQQMSELLQSPIVWIEKVGSPRAAIAYVTKYVTKQPAQFGTSKRYWCSKYYQLKHERKPQAVIMDRRNSQIVRQRFTEFLQEILRQGIVPIPISRGLLKLIPPKVLRRDYGSGEASEIHPDLVSAYLWLGSARMQTSEQAR